MALGTLSGLFNFHCSGKFNLPGRKNKREKEALQQDEARTQNFIQS